MPLGLYSLKMWLHRVGVHCVYLACRFTECSEVWTETTDYFQVVGIILGQLLVGFLGDWLGRRWGMIQVIFFSWFLFQQPITMKPCLLPCQSCICYSFVLCMSVLY